MPTNIFVSFRNSLQSLRGVGAIDAFSSQKHVENPAFYRGRGTVAEQQTTTILIVYNRGV
jgi:hypothetical protein